MDEDLKKEIFEKEIVVGEAAADRYGYSTKVVAEVNLEET